MPKRVARTPRQLEHDRLAKERMKTVVAGFQSFSGTEIRLIASLLAGTRQGSDMRSLVRHKVFANVSRKVQVMKRQVAERKALRDRLEKQKKQK